MQFGAFFQQRNWVRFTVRIEVGQSKFYFPEPGLDRAGAKFPKPFLRHFYRIVYGRNFEHQIRDKCAFLRRFQQAVEMVASGPCVLLEFRKKTVQQRASHMTLVDPMVLDRVAEGFAEGLEVEAQNYEFMLRRNR